MISSILSCAYTATCKMRTVTDDRHSGGRRIYNWPSPASPIGSRGRQGYRRPSISSKIRPKREQRPIPGRTYSVDINMEGINNNNNRTDCTGGRGVEFEKREKKNTKRQPTPSFLLRVGRESVNISLHFLSEKKKKNRSTKTG